MISMMYTLSNKLTPIHGCLGSQPAFLNREKTSNVLFESCTIYETYSLRKCTKKRRGVQIFRAQHGPDDCQSKAGLPSSISGKNKSKLDTEKELRLLRAQLREATEREDYKEAAIVRDLISSTEDADEAHRLKKLLAKAVAQERYLDASRYKAELQQLVLLEPEVSDGVQLDCSSNTITEGVRVEVRSLYVRDRSVPSKQQYFFAYRIRLTNESSRTVQLLNRHWVITDANGQIEEVRGPGVIGVQPILGPGKCYEYTSACPLRTPYGTMQGEYEMVHFSDEEPSAFFVKVGAFALNVNDEELHR